MQATFDTSKLAVVYLRQSSPGQVRDNVVATQEQYRLREIPERLGFQADRILVVDEDLGVSGQTIAGRKGMLRVLDFLEQGSVACVVVRDIGRLTRDEFNTDIGLIARQCYHAGARIVTPDKIYDPADPSDQLMLGFQGLLAGWDRGQIVRRLEHHRKAKQARGVNINGACPPGYEKTIDVAKSSLEHGKLRITSDLDVRNRIALILQKGLELKGVLTVVRFLRQHDLRVPVYRGDEARVTVGVDGKRRVITTGCRTIHWVEASREHVTRILKNPTYAGAIVNGRYTREIDRTSGKRRWLLRTSYQHCTVIRDAHAAYITWEQHHQILSTIAKNYQTKTYTKGAALLSGLGLLRCGICGASMSVFYPNIIRTSRGRTYRGTPYVYICARKHPDGRKAPCQRPAGPPLDRATKELLVFALDQIDLDSVRSGILDRQHRVRETARLRFQQVTALERRAQMLEEAIADAKRPDASARLVARFEEVLKEMETAKAALAAPAELEPQLSPELLARLEVFRDPTSAWDRFSLQTRKELLKALASRVVIYPDADGYYLVVDWDGGGRAAAKVTTTRRQRLYPVPDEVLALFAAALPTTRAACSIVSHSGTPCPRGPARTSPACGRGLP